jgi:hypothetical protein
MAYYDALIAAWNGATQPPAGVTGQPLLAGDSTQTKINKVNLWTVTGAVPTTIFLSTDQLANCVVYSEFKALTATQESNLLAMLSIPSGQAGGLIGGSANTTLLPFGMFLDLFPGGSGTRQNLNALVHALTFTWCEGNGYPFKSQTLGALTLVDASNAGLT